MIFGALRSSLTSMVKRKLGHCLKQSTNLTSSTVAAYAMKQKRCGAVFAQEKLKVTLLVTTKVLPLLKSKMKLDGKSVSYFQKMPENILHFI